MNWLWKFAFWRYRNAYRSDRGWKRCLRCNKNVWATYLSAHAASCGDHYDREQVLNLVLPWVFYIALILLALRCL